MIATYIGSVCVGIACYFLQPKQPQSAIATALLVIALICYTHKY